MIKVGYLVSYDYDMLLTSIKQLYDFVDEIYLAIDEGRKTYSGNNFEIPESFFIEMKEFDKKNIIKFYFDKFFVSELTPMECETRERIMLSKKMGKGWLIQLDVDEYVYNFDVLVNYLKNYWYLTLFPNLTPVTFGGKWITLFKELDNGFLFIENNEQFPFITNVPFYTTARRNNNNLLFDINFSVIHQSWARGENEILEKLSNWSHRDDFNTNEYFKFWKDLSSANYKKYKNIHPIVPKAWNKLIFLQAFSIDDFIAQYAKKDSQTLFKIDVKNMFKSLIYRYLMRLKGVFKI